MVLSILKKVAFLITVVWLGQGVLNAQTFHFTQTENLKAAYMAANSLQLDKAKSWLNKESRENPTNLLTHHVANYIDFYTLVILEENDLYNALYDNKEKRLALIAQGPKSSPYYLYSQAEIELQWALVRLKFEDYYKAFFDVKKAYKKLLENQSQFPDFVVNKKSLGVIHALIGTLPDKHQWGIKFLSGMEGDIVMGKKELETVINHYDAEDFFFVEEAKIMYAFVLFFILEEKQSAWNILKRANIDVNTNLLGVFVNALMAYEDEQFDLAFKLLKNRPTGVGYLDFYYLDYLQGLILLNKLDPKASYYLQRFVNNFKGKNYIKKAYELLTWHDLIYNNGQNGQAYRSKILTNGATMVDDDKGAYKSAVNNVSPNITLLRARLLFDGGDYLAAKNILKPFEITSFLDVSHQIEFCYRNGRIEQMLGHAQSALSWYQKAFNQNNNSDDLHACKSALEAGRIEEQRQSYQKSKEYYQRCLAVHPAGFENSLHMKAKAGLQRIKYLVRDN